MVLLLVGASVSMFWVLVAMVVSNLNIYLTNALLAQRYVGYTLVRQIMDVLPVLALTLVCGGAVYPLYALLGLHWLLCVAIFALLYTICGYILKLDSIAEIKSFIVSRIKRDRL